MATRKRRTLSGDIYSPHEAFDLVFDTPADFRWFKRQAAEYPETYGQPTTAGGWLFPSDPSKGRIAETLRVANGRAIDVVKARPSSGRDPRNRSRRNPKRASLRKTSRDSAEATELILFLDNDEPLYRRKKEFLKNVYTKMKRGTYSPTLARKLWMYYVEEAAKKYEKEFLNPGEWHQVFPPAVRREVAKELEERERRMIESGEYRDFPPVRVLHDPGFRRRGAPGSRRKPG